MGSLGVLRSQITCVFLEATPIQPLSGVPDSLVLSFYPLGHLGRPLGYFIFSLMALIRGPYVLIFSMGFRGQPSHETAFRSSAGTEAAPGSHQPGLPVCMGDL